METKMTPGQTQALRFYGAGEVPESPGWTLVTYDADGSMYAEDIIDSERAQELRNAGVPAEVHGS